MHWFLDPFRRVLDYSGRSRRREYWLFLLAAAIFFLLYGEIAPGGSPIQVSVEQDLSPQKGVWGILSILVALAILLPGLAVTVRRLHDINRSGLWIMLPSAPIFFWAIAIVGGFNSEILFRLVMPAILIAPVAFLIMMGWQGTTGPNRFDPDPKGAKSDPAVSI